MPRQYSLKGKKKFDLLFSKGFRFVRGLVYSIVLLNPITKSDSKSPFIAVLIPKKYINLASKRNYLKRLTREILQIELVPEIKTESVFIAIGIRKSFNLENISPFTDDVKSIAKEISTYVQEKEKNTRV